MLVVFVDFAILQRRIKVKFSNNRKQPQNTEITEVKLKIISLIIWFFNIVLCAENEQRS